MTTAIVDQIARGLLYDGYDFGPARPTALTGRPVSTRGVVLPPGSGDLVGSQVPAQCLVRAPGAAPLDVQVRFLHLASRRGEDAVWDEADERVVRLQVSLADGCARPIRESFRWPGVRTADRTQESLRGDVELLVEPVGLDPEFFRVTVVLANTTGTAGAVLNGPAPSCLLVSAHILLETRQGRFVSLLDPADGAEADAARDCRQAGLWPVLIGDPGVGDAMLAAPLPLTDYPQGVADVSQGLGEGTATADHLLVLRVLSLTEDEKREMRVGDLRGRRLLERAERLTLDGRTGAPECSTARPGTSRGVSAVSARHGAVREAPVGATALTGWLFESDAPLTLTLGPFAPAATARVLVAGVGNILRGDEGFGVEVAQRLLDRHLPEGVDVVDFGTREFELACALGAVESVILVDAYPHGCPPWAT